MKRSRDGDDDVGDAHERLAADGDGDAHRRTWQHWRASARRADGSRRGRRTRLRTDAADSAAQRGGSGEERAASQRSSRRAAPRGAGGSSTTPRGRGHAVSRRKRDGSGPGSASRDRSDATERRKGRTRQRTPRGRGRGRGRPQRASPGPASRRRLDAQRRASGAVRPAGRDEKAGRAAGVTVADPRTGVPAPSRPGESIVRPHAGGKHAMAVIGGAGSATGTAAVTAAAGGSQRDPLGGESAAVWRARGALGEQLRAAVEWYLSDANLRRDKVLRDAMTERDDEMAAGWLSLEFVAGLPRVRSLSSDRQLLVDALRSSASLVVDDAGRRVRRASALAPLTESERAEISRKTVYVEGFPVGAREDDLRALFETAGAVEFIDMPRFPLSQRSKGFSFVQFSDASVAQAACARAWRWPAPQSGDAKGGPAANLKQLRLMSKASWEELKREYKASESIGRALSRLHNSAVGGGAHGVGAALAGSRTEAFTPGLLVKVSNIAPTVSRARLRDCVMMAATPAYVDFAPESLDPPVGGAAAPREATLRFRTARDAHRVLTTFAARPLSLGGMSVGFRAVGGREEEAYWEVVHDRRREWAAKRRTDPVVASAVTEVAGRKTAAKRGRADDEG